MAMTVEPPSARHLTVRVTGAWTAPEWRSAQVTLADAVQQAPDVRGLLVIAETFLGWKGSGWDDLPAQATLDKRIERLAIVGEQQWEDLVLMFVGKGLRRMEIEYFLPANLDEARRWLTSGTRRATGGKTQ